MGTIDVRVRTVGGLESWSGTIPIVPTEHEETIGNVLSRRDQTIAAIGGQDYEILDQLVTFQVHMAVIMQREGLNSMFTNPMLNTHFVPSLFPLYVFLFIICA